MQMSSSNSVGATTVPYFSGPTDSEPVGAKADESWWKQNRTTVAGLMRVISHSMMIASGLGIGVAGSKWRVATGVSGLAGASFLTLSGSSSECADKSGKEREFCFSERVQPGHVIETYAAISTLSGLCLLASGLATGRKTEAFSGAWTTAAFIIKGAMPERRDHTSDMPGFDKNAPTQSTLAGVGGKAGGYLQAVRENPVKLGSDMLQVSAGIVMLDAIIHRDLMRGISAVCLATSNYAMREVKRSDYHYSTPDDGGVPAR